MKNKESKWKGAMKNGTLPLYLLVGGLIVGMILLKYLLDYFQSRPVH